MIFGQLSCNFAHTRSIPSDDSLNRIQSIRCLHFINMSRCLGSTQHLKGKFGQGYVLEIKLPNEQEAQGSDEENGEQIDSAESPLELFIKEVKIREGYSDGYRAVTIPSNHHIKLCVGLTQWVSTFFWLLP